MENNSNTNEQLKTNQHNTNKGRKNIVLSPFKFIMTLLSCIILTAAVTSLAILFGNEKVIDQNGPKRSEFLKFYTVYDTLTKDYYKKVDKEKLVDAAIKGMVSGLDDPYSEYMTKSEQESFTGEMSGEFSGIGAEMGEEDGKIIISSPIKGSPAEKAGVKSKDELIKIDGKDVSGMSTSKVVSKIRGKKGTTVKLTLKRGDNAPFDIKIVRDTIHIDSVESKMEKNHVAVITVNKFQEGTAKEFHEALTKMDEKGMKKLVLDFRNNPGGYLDEASKMANEFLDKGDVILYSEDRDGTQKPLKAKNPENPITKDLKTTIILNEGSASASEVFALALKDHDKATIVGTKSFGKGIVQTATPYKDDSMLKYTLSKWLSPNKTWIHKKGITPDKEIKLPSYANIHILDENKVFSLGEKSEDIKTLEIGLKALGYDPGKVDDTFDQSTLNAVNQFQIAEQVPNTGLMDKPSIKKFTQLLKEKLQKNDTQLKGAIEYVK